MAESGDLWVFGYGSLMWRPGFPFLERRHAHLHGYHRALCVYSHVHRGTPERPGLVLGLDRGGRCHGVAFRVAPEEAAETVQYLREREQVTAVYVERRLPVRLAGGETVAALAYVVDRGHPQYAGRLPQEDFAAVGAPGRRRLRRQSGLCALDPPPPSGDGRHRPGPGAARSGAVRAGSSPTSSCRSATIAARSEAPAASRWMWISLAPRD